MKKLFIIAVIGLMASPAFAETRFEKASDTTMRIIDERVITVTRQQVEQVVENSDKAKAEAEKILTEMDKLGITNREIE